MENTIDYYNNNAKSFIDATVNVNVERLHNMFLKHLHPKARILDLGCGSGRDSKIFLDSGYDVVSIDGSAELCKEASMHIGKPVKCMLFSELSYRNEFDGVWACSSLLHVPYQELDGILNKVSEALKSGGYFYISFKYGTFEGSRNGRYFTDLDEERLRELMEKNKKFSLVEVCVSGDAREDRKDGKWLNVVLKKSK